MSDKYCRGNPAKKEPCAMQCGITRAELLGSEGVLLNQESLECRGCGHAFGVHPTGPVQTPADSSLGSRKRREGTPIALLDNVASPDTFKPREFHVRSFQQADGQFVKKDFARTEGDKLLSTMTGQMEKWIKTQAQGVVLDKKSCPLAVFFGMSGSGKTHQLNQFSRMINKKYPTLRVVTVAVTFNQNQSPASDTEIEHLSNSLAIRFVHHVRGDDTMSLDSMLGAYVQCDPRETLNQIRVRLGAEFMLVEVDETLELAKHVHAYKSMFRMLGSWQQEEWTQGRRALVVFTSLVKSSPHMAIEVGTRRPMEPCFLGVARWRELDGLLSKRDASPLKWEEDLILDQCLTFGTLLQAAPLIDAAPPLRSAETVTADVSIVRNMLSRSLAGRQERLPPTGEMIDFVLRAIRSEVPDSELVTGVISPIRCGNEVCPDLCAPQPLWMDIRFLQDIDAVPNHLEETRQSISNALEFDRLTRSGSEKQAEVVVQRWELVRRIAFSDCSMHLQQFYCADYAGKMAKAMRVKINTARCTTIDDWEDSSFDPASVNCMCIATTPDAVGAEHISTWECVDGSSIVVAVQLKIVHQTKWKEARLKMKALQEKLGIDPQKFIAVYMTTQKFVRGPETVNDNELIIAHHGLQHFLAALGPCHLLRQDPNEDDDDVNDSK